MCPAGRLATAAPQPHYSTRRGERTIGENAQSGAVPSARPAGWWAPLGARGGSRAARRAPSGRAAPPGRPPARARCAGRRRARAGAGRRRGAAPARRGPGRRRRGSARRTSSARWPSPGARCATLPPAHRPRPRHRPAGRVGPTWPAAVGAASCPAAYRIVLRSTRGNHPLSPGDLPRRASRDHRGIAPAGAGGHTGRSAALYRSPRVLPLRGAASPSAPPRPLASRRAQ